MSVYCHGGLQFTTHVDRYQSRLLCAASGVGADPGDEERRSTEGEGGEVETEEERSQVIVGARESVQQCVTDLCAC